MKGCAYCGKDKDYTREHIYPNFILRSFEHKMLTINDKTNYYYEADPVIKDVCSECNNGVLSNLDAAFVNLYHNYMSKPINAGDSVHFSFDYNLLLRELLKISYNSVRASKNAYEATSILKRFIPYIIGKSQKNLGVMLSLLIVTSSNAIDPLSKNVIYKLEPNLLRNGEVSGLHISSNIFITRLVAFNSFWFYLHIPKKTVNSLMKKNYWDLFKSRNHLHGVLLKVNESTISIPKEKTTYLHTDLLAGMKRDIR